MESTSQNELELLRSENTRLKLRLADEEASSLETNGRPFGTHATVSDLLRASSVLESITDAFFGLDHNWAFAYLNKEAEHLLARSRLDLLGRNVWQEFPEAVGTLFDSEYHRATREEKTVKFEAFYPPLNNWFEVRAYPLSDGLAVFFQDVSDRKRTEMTLRQREADFRAILDNVPVLVSSVDRAGRIRRVNRRYQEIFGRDPDWAAGRTLDEAAGEPHYSIARKYLEGAIAGEAAVFESKIHDRSGRLRDIRATYTPQRDLNGDLDGFIAMVEDITEGKRAEEALRESEHRLRLMAESLPQLVWTCLPDGNCEYLSAQWVAYTGLPEKDQLGLAWLDLVMHPDDKERTYQAWMAAVGDEAPYDLEYRLRRYDGEYRWFKTRGTPLRDTQGRIVRWFGTCTDIDDRRRGEEERQALLQREQQARAMAELLNRVGPMLLTELNSQRVVQRVTELATELIGAEFGFFRQNPAHEIETPLPLVTSGEPPGYFENHLSSVDAGIFRETFLGKQLLLGTDFESGDCSSNTFTSFDNRGTAAKELRSFLAVPVASRSGQVIGGLFFCHSEECAFSEQHAKLITGVAAQAAIALDNARLFSDAQRSQEALKRSNSELRQANLDLEQFAFAAAHDLQEPLRMLTSYTQLLDRTLKDVVEGRTRDFMHYVVSGARRMSLLLEDLLAYTETSRDSEIPLEVLDLNHVLSQTLRNLGSAITESGASVAADDLPSLRGREAHFIQLFQNLIGNAIKYCRPDEAPRVRIDLESRDNFWLFKIRDNGIGIDPAYHRQVFGVFKRLHGSEIPGSGIGLAICQRVVERAGGAIWVESVLGEGSTFCFTIPKSE